MIQHNNHSSGNNHGVLSPRLGFVTSMAPVRCIRFGIAWLLACLVLFQLTACSTEPVKRDDPLIGKIYQASGALQIDREQLFTQMNKARVIYLGETHDNPRHHQLQIEILEALIKRGRRPALGFEFFSLEQSSYLMHFTRARPVSAGMPQKEITLEQLRKQLGWEAREQDWAFYSPLLKLAKKHHLPVFGADLAPGLIQRISRVGMAGLSALERRLLYPSGFKNPDYRQQMYKQFTLSHCGWSESGLLGRLYDTWVARNDAMAMAIGEFLGESATEPVVMILGAGHVVRNMAVYERVEHKHPDLRQLNLGLRPVEISPLALADYLQPQVVDGKQFPSEHEYIWFTQRVSYIDPCERFKEHLKKHQG